MKYENNRRKRYKQKFCIIKCLHNVVLNKKLKIKPNKQTNNFKPVVN